MKRLMLLLFLSSFCLANIDLELVPMPPKMQNKGYILVSENTNQVLAENNSEKQVEPASLTKLMSLFIVANSLEQKTITLDDEVLISKKAWKQPGSRMFVKVGSHVKLKQLIQGSAVVSGNDATVALAEHIAGSEQRFVEMMNATAKKLGMNHTHYANSTGLPAKNHITSPKDLSILARAWFAHFPKQTAWFHQKFFKYNKIKQSNRNKLLWTDKTVDGMKTGYTRAAGYCLVSSAIDHGERLIVVIAGAKSRTARFEQSSQLINYGFHFFENKKFALLGEKLGSTAIYLGNKESIDYGPDKNIVLSIPKGQDSKYTINKIMHKKITAPIKPGDIIGTAEIATPKENIKFNLLALTEIKKANFPHYIASYVKMLFS